MHTENTLNSLPQFLHMQFLQAYKCNQAYLNSQVNKHVDYLLAVLLLDGNTIRKRHRKSPGMREG